MGHAQQDPVTPPLPRKEPKMTFEEYCDENNIQPGEGAATFAAYLHAFSGGSWDGAQHEVAPPEGTKP